ncbi:hypothetical protein Pint_14247 [Pistacia integerrima]|uniref:Uncharacterized protein n=1 Tax=Pistacia integerrima TaxID=434235 RepID=A0ACC0Y880_9ROSI|nr:hypothetical protein Pint_14247 [Pistacia integerrima]
MAKLNHCFFFFFFFFVLLISSCEGALASKVDTVRVGVILDLNSSVGRIAQRYISMALSHFYAVNNHFRTNLTLVTRDSQNDVVVASFGSVRALDLMKNEKVHAIIGPQRSEEAQFLIDLGRKTNVPIISFSATSPSLSPTKNEFFIRTAHDDSCQVKAIADILKSYGWMELILIYEDTNYGNGLIPYLTDALREVNARVLHRCVISPGSGDSEIRMKLKSLKENYAQTRIFLVHMTASVGSKLFLQAKKSGIMDEGYAWIVTEGLSSLLDPVHSKAINSMEGVLGLRPFIPFSSRKVQVSKLKSSIKGQNLFGLWAYDTVWAVATAVEKSGMAHSGFVTLNTGENEVDIAALGTFKDGRKLLNALLNTTFDGVSGEFHLVKGQLQPSTFEIFNVVGKHERIIGYWTQTKGLRRDLNDNGNKAVNSKLKNPVWPGDNTINQPNNKLRIGIPVRNAFTEFINVENETDVNGGPKISGFSYEVFMAVLEVLEFPLPHEFIHFGENGTMAGTYDELLYKIKYQEYDAVVGDTAIVANRSTYVDFTLPYSESGVSMVVLVKDNEKKDFWIFLKPLSLDLWLTTGLVFILIGLVIWVLEHRINTEFRGPPEHQLGTIFWFSFSTLVFAHREKLVNNLSKFVLIIWIFVVLILTQSYTASLASMLTVKQLRPLFDDVQEIRKHGYFVGYQNNSFVKDLLLNQLRFSEDKLRPYNTPEEYNVALSKGEVAAIFDGIPYIKLFLNKYCSNFTIIGPIYKTEGLGFAFQQGSPLVPYMSRAILKVTEDKDKMEAIKRKTFRSKPTCEDKSATISSGSNLSVYSFGGLFIITGVASISALLLHLFNFIRSHWPVLNDHHLHSERSFLAKIVDLIKHFDKKDHSSYHFNRSESTVYSAQNLEANFVASVPNHIADVQNHSRTSSEGGEDNDTSIDTLHTS